MPGYSKKLRAAAVGVTAATAMILSCAVAPAWAADPSVSTKADLTNYLSQTELSDLRPLRSGGDSDTPGGTAPYDSARPNSEDAANLESARQAAWQVVRDPASTPDQIRSAATNVSNAFQKVRFVYHYDRVTGTKGASLYDNQGNLLQAHGAGITEASTSVLPKKDQSIDANHDGIVYILIGEDKTNRLVARGPHLYFSDDLLNWKDEGLAFQMYHGEKDLQNRLAGGGTDPAYHKFYNVKNIQSDPDYTNIYGKDFKAFANDPSNNNISSPQDVLTKSIFWDLKALKGNGEDPTASSAVFERPKIAYNTLTKRWVIWFHADGPKYDNENTATYSKAKAGVAISVGSDPAGPYKYLGSFRLGPGYNSSNPGMARDMNLFIDDKDANHDGVNDAYLIYSSNENRDLTISLLDKTYTKLVKPIAQQKMGTSVADGDTYNVVARDSKEAPAPFKYNGRYYIVYSGTTGWAPNENKYEVSESDSFLGPYDQKGTPFVQGQSAHQSPSTSFDTQASMMIPIDPAKGIFAYWGDRWFNPDTGHDISQSRYVMTPVQFVNGDLKILPAEDWDFSQVKDHAAITVTQKFPRTAESVSNVQAHLPKQVEYSQAGRASTGMTPVVWNPVEGPDKVTRPVTFTGILPQVGNAPISFTTNICPKDTYLFMDAGSNPNDESDYYKDLLANDSNLMNRTVSDQTYDPSKGRTWGMSSVLHTDVELYGTTSSDIFDTGWWAKGGKEIDYKANLPAGRYIVLAGYHDWWNSRTMTFSAEANGQTLASANLSVNGGQTVSPELSFNLSSPQTVTFRTRRQPNQQDPILSWISVRKLTGTDVVSVQPVSGVHAFLDGSSPEAGLPKSVTVALADGTRQNRSVTWSSSVSEPEWVPTKVNGTVEGTDLLASATVQKIPANLSYFIDVNSASSPTFNRVKTLEGTSLINRVSDQTYTRGATWGNSSTLYERQNGDGDADDPYESGLSGGNGSVTPRKHGTLSYALTLPAGRQKVSLGLYDWWAYEDRPISATYSWDGMSTPAKLGDITLKATDGHGNAKTILSGVVTVPKNNTKTVITLSSPEESGSSITGPVLSWISVAPAGSTPSTRTVTSIDTTSLTNQAGTVPSLPSNVTVRYSDGTSGQKKVTWSAIDWAHEKEGLVVVTGSVEGTSLKALAFVTLERPATPLNQPPTFTGVGPLTISQGTAFNPLTGVKATDREDGDLTSKITVSGSVDTSTPGTYTLIYKVVDSGGATSTASRVITVTANTPSEPGTPSGPVQPVKPGKPVKPSHVFRDVAPGSWYEKAVYQMADKGVMTGYADGTFYGPNDVMTREQAAVAFYRLAGSPSVKGAFHYRDGRRVSGWARRAVLWAYQKRVLTGYANRMFGPQDRMTREQAATALARFAGVKAPDTKTGFAWAVSHHVVNGWSGKRLDPTGVVTRAQMAQILANAINHKLI